MRIVLSIFAELPTTYRDTQRECIDFYPRMLGVEQNTTCCWPLIIRQCVKDFDVTLLADTQMQ